MSSFTSPLKVKVLDNGDKYELLEDFSYFKEDNHNITIKVEKGFITDFASVPRIFWSLFPPFGRYTKAAVLHDRLCEAFHRKESWHDLCGNKDPKVIKRKDADSIFLESMLAINVNKATAYTLYFFVRSYSILRHGANV